WNLATGQKRTFAHGQLSPLKALTFSRDGKQLVSGDGQSVKCWDVATGEARIAAAAKGGRGRLEVFSHDGRTLAGVRGNAALTLRDLSSLGGPVGVKGLRDDRLVAC